MKRKRSLFLAMLILTLLATIGLFRYWRIKVTTNEVRIAYSVPGNDMPKLDPAKINSVYQSILLTNLYSRLIEYDLNGNLQSGIATKFFWQDNKLIFEFGSKSLTKSGHSINANDAAITIRRVIKLGSSTHTNLKYFLCSDSEKMDVFKDCDSIYVENDRLILKIENEKQKHFVISTLAAGDFAIIPESAIDRTTLEINDFTETSGPYYIASSNDKWTLLQNNGHYQLTTKSPKKVTLVPTNTKSAVDLFLENEADVIPTAMNIGQSDFVKIKEHVKDVEVYKTLPIKLFLIKYSLASIKKTSTAQRFSIAKQFRKIMTEEYPLPILSEPAKEFFLDNGYGQLTTTQQHDLDKIAKEAKPTPLTNKVTFYLYKDLKQIFSVFGKIKELDLIETPLYPFNQPLEDRLDLSLITTDTGYEEDLSLLGYNFNQGTFGYNKIEAHKWLSRYLNEEKKEKRAEMARELQFNALKDGVIFPLFKAPYTILTRNGFSTQISPIFASTHFWRLQKNEL